jgi:hypothetical protein
MAEPPRRGERLHAGALAWRSRRALHGPPTCHTSPPAKYGHHSAQSGAIKDAAHFMVRQLATHTFGGGTGEPRRRFLWGAIRGEAP